MQQYSQEVENFLGGTDTTGEHDNPVATSDEGFQAFLNVRHDHQFIDDGVGCLCTNNAGLGNADVAAVLDPLLGVANGGAFHGTFHRPRATSGTDAQGPEPQLMTDILDVLVFVMAD